MRLLLTLISFMIITTPAVAEDPLRTGSWTFVGGSGEMERAERLVDEVVDEMRAVMRPIARSRLKREAHPWKSVSIQWEGEDIAVRFGEGVDFFVSPPGKKVTTRKGFTLERQLRDGVLVERFEERRGGRINEYRVSREGLRVTSTIFSSQLPRPIVFTYTYR